MRVVQFRERVRIDLEHILVVVLAHPLELAVVAFDQRRDYLLGRFLGQLEAQHFIFDALAPTVVQLRSGPGPVPFIGIDGKAFIHGEVHGLDLLRQGFDHIFHSLFQSLLETVEDLKARHEISLVQLVIHCRAVLFKFRKVGRGEKHLAPVQAFDIAVQVSRGHIVVVAVLGVMALFQLANHLHDSFALAVAGLYRRPGGQRQEE